MATAGYKLGRKRQNDLFQLDVRSGRTAFSVDKDSDWTMELKVRTAPKEDARLNAVRSLPYRISPPNSPLLKQRLKAQAIQPRASRQKIINSVVMAGITARK